MNLALDQVSPSVTDCLSLRLNAKGALCQIPASLTLYLLVFIMPKSLWGCEVWLVVFGRTAAVCSVSGVCEGRRGGCSTACCTSHHMGRLQSRQEGWQKATLSLHQSYATDGLGMLPESEAVTWSWCLVLSISSWKSVGFLFWPLYANKADMVFYSDASSWGFWSGLNSEFQRWMFGGGCSAFLKVLSRLYRIVTLHLLRLAQGHLHPQRVFGLEGAGGQR